MVYVMLGNGFEEMEAIAPVDILRRAGIEVLTAGVSGKTVCGSHCISIEADITVEEMDLMAMDMIVIPGGLGGVASLRSSEQTMQALQFAWDNGKYIAAICAGPTVLADLGITDGRNVTCYPGQEVNMGGANVDAHAAVVADGSVITAASAGCAIPFALALVEALKGKAAAEKIRKDLVIR